MVRFVLASSRGRNALVRITAVQAGTPSRPLLTTNQIARRQRIVHTAMAMLEEREYERIQMKDVADGASVALGTVYRYFTSKEHLFSTDPFEPSNAVPGWPDWSPVWRCLRIRSQRMC
jgi:hypothetical protein